MPRKTHVYAVRDGIVVIGDTGLVTECGRTEGEIRSQVSDAPTCRACANALAARSSGTAGSRAVELLRRWVAGEVTLAELEDGAKDVLGLPRGDIVISGGTHVTHTMPLVDRKVWKRGVLTGKEDAVCRYMKQQGWREESRNEKEIAFVRDVEAT